MNVSQKFFRQVLLNFPNLCAAGLAGPDFCRQARIDFDSERRRLEEAFSEFAACCDWLLDCTPLKHVSFVSPISAELTASVEKEAGIPVSNGALIAAVIHMRIPHQHLPDSPDARIGISRNSPALRDGLPAGKAPVRRKHK